MESKIYNEISRLMRMRELCHETYLVNLEDVQEKIEKVNNQIKQTESTVKIEILERQRTLYNKEIRKLDNSMEKTTDTLNQKINVLQVQLNNIQKERESFEYNIEKIRNGIENENTGDIFNLFSNVLNALEILKKETNEIDQKSEHSS
jgi:predicted  nucleic acid-binding Zn-ribbon protein|tara:strand:- start:233 stop:676 length:444 start_codon:yes stop_codon:yes gene_type:complete